MARLRNEPILESDLIEYLEFQSDFAFELQILNWLHSQQFECEHGATYEDTLTNKIRQFDIRAVRKIGYAQICFALECKRIGVSFPLLVLRMPRTIDEGFHELLLTVDTDVCQIAVEPNFSESYLGRKAINIRVQDQYGLYPPGDLVGKACAQVGRDSNGITSTDSEMFSKWTQAISSGQDLIQRVIVSEPTDQEGWLVSAIIPVVVVPDGTLWVADHDKNGRRTRPPCQADHCAYFIRSLRSTGDHVYGTRYTISHLEFVTESGLCKLMERFHTDGRPCGAVFPESTIKQRICI